MSKCYLVFEYGGEYEDAWEHPIAVCATKELAENLVSTTLAKRECSISHEDWIDLCTEVDESFEYEDYDKYSDAELIHKLHPEYSLEVLQRASDIYGYLDWQGIEIKELDFINGNNA